MRTASGWLALGNELLCISVRVLCRTHARISACRATYMYTSSGLQVLCCPNPVWPRASRVFLELPSMAAQSSVFSKQWSCSTFLDGARHVDHEATSEQLLVEEAALQQEIEDSIFTVVGSGRKQAYMLLKFMRLI